MSNSSFPNAQNNPGAAVPVYDTGYAAKNITTSASTLVKTGVGTFGRVTVNTAQAGATVTAYDGIDNTGVKLATISAAAQVSLAFGVALATGLYVVTAGATPADITVAYL
jgi:hypothetical protein